MKKVDKTNWFTEGFEILEKDGFAKITIEHLCSRLEISKGSFYYHFKNMDGYIEALMGYWLEENTLSIIRKVNESKKIKSKKNALDQLALERSLRLEQSIRAWGYSNDAVMKRVREADKIRLEYLIELEIQDGKKRPVAKDVAMLTYATLIGLQQLFPDLPKKEQIRLQQFYAAKF